MDDLKVKIQLPEYLCIKCNENLGIELKHFKFEISKDPNYAVEGKVVCICSKCNCAQLVSQSLKGVEIAMIKGLI